MKFNEKISESWEDRGSKSGVILGFFGFRFRELQFRYRKSLFRFRELRFRFRNSSFPEPEYPFSGSGSGTGSGTGTGFLVPKGR